MLSLKKYHLKKKNSSSDSVELVSAK